MTRTQDIHTIAAQSTYTPDGVLALVRALAQRWPDRPLAQLARDLQSAPRPAPSGARQIEDTLRDNAAQWHTSPLRLLNEAAPLVVILCNEAAALRARVAELREAMDRALAVDEPDSAIESLVLRQIISKALRGGDRICPACGMHHAPHLCPSYLPPAPA